jgi:methyltransferase
VDPLDLRILYTALVATVALMRLAELAVSRRNIARLLERGGVEVGQSLYPWMVAVHTVFLVACVAEVWLFDRPLIPGLAVFMLCLLAIAAILRWWVISALGDRWSTRVVFVPGDPPVTTGPFRWLRHPNYLAVIIEFFALPLVHTAWLTAIVFSVANAALLVSRVRTEETALAANSDYRDVMHRRPRFYPGRR